METSLVVIRDGKGQKMIGRAPRLFRTVKILCMILYCYIYIIIRLSRPIECIAPKANHNVDCRLLMIMMCQCKFIIDKNRITLMGDVNNGRDCMYGIRRYIGDLSTFLLILL